MPNNSILEIFTALILIVLSLLILNPFDFFMPDMFYMGIIAVLIIVFGIFGAFVLREKAIDERESANKMLSGRIAFMLGAATLVAGIAYQSLSHDIDPWLVFALVVMIVGKLGSSLYVDKKL